MKKIFNFNYKKIFIMYAILAVIFLIAAISTGFGVFGNRIETVINTYESSEDFENDNDEIQNEEKESKNENEQKGKYFDQENDEFNSEEGEDDKGIELCELINLTNGEVVLIEVIAAVGVILLIVYWLLIVGLTLKLTKKYNADSFVFGIVSILLNIGAIILLYIYKRYRCTCKECGKIQSRKSTYCTCCGASLKNECKNCKHLNNISNEFCSNCGNEIK